MGRHPGERRNEALSPGAHGFLELDCWIVPLGPATIRKNTDKPRTRVWLTLSPCGESSYPGQHLLPAHHIREKKMMVLAAWYFNCDSQIHDITSPKTFRNEKKKSPCDPALGSVRDDVSHESGATAGKLAELNILTSRLQRTFIKKVKLQPRSGKTLESLVRASCPECVQRTHNSTTERRATQLVKNYLLIFGEMIL